MASEVKISEILRDIKALPDKGVQGRKEQKERIDSAISQLSLAALGAYRTEVDITSLSVRESKKRENQFLGAVDALRQIRTDVASTKDKKTIRLYKQLQDRVYRLAQPLADKEPNKGVLEANNNETTRKRKEAKAALMFGALEKKGSKDLAGGANALVAGQSNQYSSIFEAKDSGELQPFKDALEKKREIWADPNTDYGTKSRLKKEILVIRGNILQQEMLLIKPGLAELGFHGGGIDPNNIAAKSSEELHVLEGDLNDYEGKFKLLVEKTARERVGYHKFEQEHKGYITAAQEAEVKPKIDAARKALEQNKISEARFNAAGFGPAADNGGVISFDLSTKSYKEVQLLKQRLAEFEAIHAEQKERKLSNNPKASLLNFAEKQAIQARINGAKKAIEAREAEIKALGEGFKGKIDAIRLPAGNKDAARDAALADLAMLDGSDGFSAGVVNQWRSVIQNLHGGVALKASKGPITPEEVVREEAARQARERRWAITNGVIDLGSSVLRPIVTNPVSVAQVAIVPTVVLAALYYFVVPMLF